MQEDIYWSIEVISCELQATLSGPHIASDHQRIRISVGRLPRKESCHKKGRGFETSYKSYDLLAYNLVFYAPSTISISVFIAHCWMHVSFWWNIRPDCNLDVSTLFKKARCAQFSLRECCRTLLIWVKSSFRIKIDAAGCRQMDFKLRCRFHRSWYLNSFEVWVAQRVVGLIYCCSNFLLPHNPIADQFSYLFSSLFVFGVV